MRPNEDYAINGATASSTVPAWKKMQKDTTAKTGWINYVHQHEKIPSKNHNSKWRAPNANSTISNFTHRETSTILAPNFDPAHHESHADSQENTSIVLERIRMSNKTLIWYFNGLIIKVIPVRMDCTQLDAKMVDRIRKKQLNTK